MSLAAIIMRHSWGVILTILFIGIIYHYGWFTRNLLSYKGFNILGRISYSGYVCHIFILKLLMVGTHQMMEISFPRIVSYFHLFLLILIKLISVDDYGNMLCTQQLFWFISYFEH